jgi:nucleotide-binding universal stress UspA family protein
VFKQILISTHGSPITTGAALKGIERARALGARVTALHVSPRFHVMPYRTEMLEDTRDEYERDSRLHAGRRTAHESGQERLEGLV